MQTTPEKFSSPDHPASSPLSADPSPDSTGKKKMNDRKHRRDYKPSARSTDETRRNKFVCKLCPYRGLSMNTMKRHVLQVHTDIRPYMCPYCDYGHVEEYEIKRHIIGKQGRGPGHPGLKVVINKDLDLIRTLTDLAQDMFTRLPAEEPTQQTINMASFPKKSQETTSEEKHGSGTDVVSTRTDSIAKTPEEAIARILEEIAHKNRAPEPIVEKPPVDKPVVQKPVEDKPMVQKPTEDKPIDQKPVVQKPEIDKPEVQKPAVDITVVQKPAVDKPMVQKPVVQKPDIDKPVLQKPEMTKPAVQTSSIDIPVFQKPAIEKQSVIDGREEGKVIVAKKSSTVERENVSSNSKSPKMDFVSLESTPEIIKTSEASVSGVTIATTSTSPGDAVVTTNATAVAKISPVMATTSVSPPVRPRPVVNMASFPKRRTSETGVVNTTTPPAEEFTRRQSTGVNMASFPKRSSEVNMASFPKRTPVLNMASFPKKSIIEKLRNTKPTSDSSSDIIKRDSDDSSLHNSKDQLDSLHGKSKDLYSGDQIESNSLNVPNKSATKDHRSKHIKSLIEKSNSLLKKINSKKHNFKLQKKRSKLHMTNKLTNKKSRPFKKKSFKPDNESGGTLESDASKNKLGTVGGENRTPQTLRLRDKKSKRQVVTSDNLLPILETGEAFSCKNCQYKTNFLSCINRHVMLQHINIRPFLCPYCKYNNIDTYEVKRHIARCHRGQPVKVSINAEKRAALERINTHDWFNVHRETVLKRGKGPPRKRLKSEQTDGEIMPSNSPIATSEGAQTPVKEPIQINEKKDEVEEEEEEEEETYYGCKECEFRTPMMYLINAHVQKHIKDICPYSCPMCTFSSSEAEEVRQHILREHQASKRIRINTQLLWEQKQLDPKSMFRIMKGPSEERRLSSGGVDGDRARDATNTTNTPRKTSPSAHRTPQQKKRHPSGKGKTPPQSGKGKTPKQSGKGKTSQQTRTRKKSSGKAKKVILEQQKETATKTEESEIAKPSSPEQLVDTSCDVIDQPSVDKVDEPMKTEIEPLDIDPPNVASKDPDIAPPSVDSPSVIPSLSVTIQQDDENIMTDVKVEDSFSPTLVDDSRVEVKGQIDILTPEPDTTIEDMDITPVCKPTDEVATITEETCVDDKVPLVLKIKKLKKKKKRRRHTCLNDPKLKMKVLVLLTDVQKHGEDSSASDNDLTSSGSSEMFYTVIRSKQHRNPSESCTTDGTSSTCSVSEGTKSPTYTKITDNYFTDNNVKNNVINNDTTMKQGAKSASDVDTTHHVSDSCKHSGQIVQERLRHERTSKLRARSVSSDKS